MKPRKRNKKPISVVNPKSPNAIRKGIESGKLAVRAGWVPKPPKEWREYRRKRMTVAIRAAIIYVIEQKSWMEVRKQIHRQFGLQSDDVSRQQIHKYIQKGCQFLELRGVFVERW